MPGLRDFIPPVIKDQLLRLGAAGNRYRHGFNSWEEAKAKTSGYDSEEVLKAIVRSAQAVRDGAAAYERDGVLLDTIQYSWPLLASLLGTPRKAERLKVLDWGGSLGSSFRQNIGLLQAAGLEVDWTVIEQPHIAEVGRLEFQSDHLKFVSDTSGLEVGSIDVALFASSICYVENPENVITEIISLRPRRIIFDRTPQARGLEDLIGIQKVGKGIYQASYPIRSFGKGKLEFLLSPSYALVSSWKCDLQPDPDTDSMGFCFQAVAPN